MGTRLNWRGNECVKMASKKRGVSVKTEHAKRQKTLARDVHERQEVEESEGFVEGAIVRVKLKNFVTYDECEFRPGPKLNVLIGPNGTGKSSVVCALCLGLAGGTKLLGRATEVGEFVKHGKSQALIEIELYNADNPHANHVITREIYRTENKSVWKINGRSSTMKEVQERTKQLNVQISNLCQFLPQDKVAEFAKMTQQQLLEATEKAVGPPDMFDCHQRLVELRKTEKEKESSVKSNQEHLAQEEQRNERLEHEVKRYEERERHLEKVQILEKKRPWAEYEEARQQFLSVKAKKEDVKKQLENARKANAPMERKLQEVADRVKQADIHMREQNERGSNIHRTAKAKSEQLEKQEDKLAEHRQELKDSQDQEKRRLKKVNDLQLQLQGIQNELEQLTDPGELQPRIEEINQEARQKSREATSIQQRCNRIKEDLKNTKGQVEGIRKRITELEDMKNRRLNSLRGKHRDTYNAVMWLRDNQDKFQGTVYEPILMQVEMKDVKNARFIENLISQNDMRAFVCENTADLKKFLEEVRDQQGLKVNAVAPPPESLSSYKPQHTLDHLQKWKFHSYLSDLFTAPDPILRYLWYTYRVYNIPLGTDWTSNNADAVMNQTGLYQFFTPQSRYSGKKSQYSGQLSTTVSHIREAKFFNIAVDREQKRRLEQELQAAEIQHQADRDEYKQLEERHKTLSGQIEQLRKEKKTLTDKMQRRKTLENQYATKQSSLENLEKEAPDLKKEEEKIHQKILQTNVHRAQLAVQFQEAVKGCLGVAKNKLLVSLQQAQAAAEKSKIEEAIRESSQQLARLEDDFLRVKAEFDQQKKRAKDLKKAAHDKTGIPDGEDIPQDLKEAFKLYPDTLHEIDERIHEERARAECNYQTDASVVREYEQRKKEIQHLSAKLQDQEKALEHQRREIESLKERWLDPLKVLVGKINEKYGQFFRMMGCAGEVSLAMDQGESNYDKYGIQIKVKFRARDALHVLTPFHQSGGERSVSTMLYLMALQELTKCPFRVVDEINQGMDPNNERRVFELVVQTACRPNTSQYFLITPKLLPNLTYTDKMTILCVFNGHWMLPHTEWNLKKFLRQRKRS